MTSLKWGRFTPAPITPDWEKPLDEVLILGIRGLGYRVSHTIASLWFIRA
jgi:hypothetical protein